PRAQLRRGRDDGDPDGLTLRWLRRGRSLQRRAVRSPLVCEAAVALGPWRVTCRRFRCGRASEAVMTSLGGVAETLTMEPRGHASSRPTTRHCTPALRQRLMVMRHTRGLPANQ